MNDMIAAIAAPAPASHDAASGSSTAVAKTEATSDAATAFAGAFAAAIALLGTMKAPALSRLPETGTGAATETSALPKTDADKVQKDLSALTPAMRSRLERVVARMKSEYGHDVKIVETARTPERQDSLYAKGRTEPGTVVTWTRDSRHLSGNAADVVVDPSHEGAVGYQHLARIAADEGLHTLGARDPGHVELPRNARVVAVDDLPVVPSVVTSPPASGSKLAAAGPREMPPVFSEHSPLVAKAATVATVARVAEVAPVKFAAAPVVAEARKSAGRGAEAATVARTVPPLAASHLETPHGAMASALAAPPPAASGQQGLMSAPMVHSSEAAQRVARVLQLQDTAVVRNPTSVLLRFDDPTSGPSSVRVGLRGSAVDAAIGFMNASDATRMESRFGELQQALGRQGLSTESLTAHHDNPTFGRGEESGTAQYDERRQSRSRRQHPTEEQQ